MSEHPLLPLVALARPGVLPPAAIRRHGAVMSAVLLSSVSAMNWVQDMTARWVRILTASSDDSTPLDEAVRQISAIGGTAGKTGPLRRLKQNAPASAEASAVTTLSRQLVAGVLVGDFMLDRLCELTGQSRQQFLDQLTGDVPDELKDQQVRALQAELSGGCRQLQDPERASYEGLGTRIEQLLRLAEQQASVIIDEAREAAKITSSAAGDHPATGAGQAETSKSKSGDGSARESDLPAAAGYRRNSTRT